MKDADSHLPRHIGGREKDWWTPELTHLKRQSVEIQNLWISVGRPGNGPTNQERLRVRLAYRRAIKAAQNVPKQQAWNRLYSAMEVSDTTNFWNSWKVLHNKKSSTTAPVVDGCSL